jgi:hypothetical protein
MIAVFGVPVTIMLEVVMLVVAARLMAAARKVNVRMIAVVCAVAVVGQDCTSFPQREPTGVGGRRIRASTAGDATHNARHALEVFVACELDEPLWVPHPELGEGLGRPAGPPAPAGRRALRRLAVAAPLAPTTPRAPIAERRVAV